MNVVNSTLKELNSLNKPVIWIFNKIDSFSFVKRDEFDLTPVLKENRSLDDLRRTWMASDKEYRSVFISAKTKENIEEFRRILYEEVKRIHVLRYPYNDFLYDINQAT